MTPEMVVRVRLPQLHTFTRTDQFDQVAAQHRFTDTRSFNRFLDALLDIGGIDYDGLRHAENAHRAEEQRVADAACHGPRLTVWSAATLTTFTLCRGDGQVIWRDRIPTTVGGIEAAQTSALHAIWLAGQAREQLHTAAATLDLRLDRGRGLDLESLRREALAAALVLEATVVAVHNPAAERCAGEVVDWRGIDLSTLRHPQDPGRPREPDDRARRATDGTATNAAPRSPGPSRPDLAPLTEYER
ncbi:hypothetical protein ACFWPH_32875 [Nocardia sp. NPDC058499]|uniref:hypothetical protein n=1 Tax=Nocardia sp. NPDC058499 TaxID=3346530 RepID=UPI0036502A49